jgi:hypothetical protein
MRDTDIQMLTRGILNHVPEYHQTNVKISLTDQTFILLTKKIRNPKIVAPQAAPQAAYNTNLGKGIQGYQLMDKLMKFVMNV